MTARIVVPPKVYLDTNHLICIARLRAGNTKGVAPKYQDAYRLMDDCIVKGSVGVIVHLRVMIEWSDGRATPTASDQIARVPESAKLRYVVEDAKFICTAELLDECVRQCPCIRVPQIEKLQQFNAGGVFRSTHVVLGRIPDYFPSEDRRALMDFPETMPVERIRDLTRAVRDLRTAKPGLAGSRGADYDTNLSTETASKEEVLDRLARVWGEPAYRLLWLKRHFKIHLLLAHSNAGIDVDGLVAGVDLGRCPALSLWLKAREHRVRAGRAPRKNESDDWSALELVPYADVVWVDKEFRGFLLQADRTLESKVVANPNDAIGLVEKHLSPQPVQDG